jgi:hypothetical protein
MVYRLVGLEAHQLPRLFVPVYHSKYLCCVES